MFNYFGVTYTDIVESFSGAISADFATNSKTGREIIENELERAEAEVLEILSIRESQLLTRMQGIQVEIDSNGNITYPSQFPISSNPDLKLYSKPKNETCDISWADFYSCEIEGSCPCGNTVVTQEISGAIPVSTRDYYASYNVAIESISLPSLANYIRDRTAYILGSNLYSRSGKDSTWDLVRIYGERADMFMKNAMSKVFSIPELKKYKWLISPVPSRGFNSIKMYRS